jgi:DNA polymerase IIIc chi subunit
MSKKITMSTKPKTSAPLSADDWVSHGGNGAVSAATPIAIANDQEAEKEPTARFTIDIPVSLHARIKSQCALKRVKMREEVLSMLEEKFPVV